MIERQPGHHRFARLDLGGVQRCVDVGRQHTIGDHDALRLAGRSARVLQDDQALGVVVRQFEAIAVRHVGCARQDRPHRFDRRVALDGGVEVGELVVDQHELRVAVPDAAAGALDECVERPHSHREGQHHRRDAGQPAAAHDGHQLSTGRPEHGDVVAGQQPLGLQRSADCTSVVVNLAPGDHRRATVGVEVSAEHRRTDEADAGAEVGGVLPGE